MPGTFFSVFCSWSNVPLTTTHEVDVTIACPEWVQGWRPRELERHAQGPAAVNPMEALTKWGPCWCRLRLDQPRAEPWPLQKPWQALNSRAPALVYALPCDSQSTSFLQACFFLKSGSVELRRESYSRVFKEPLYLLWNKLGTLRFHWQL